MTHHAETEPRSAYIHVPFCIHRCGYCDFTVIANRDDLMESYLQALSEELQSLGSQRKLKTLFLGGGTPTYLPEAELDRFMKLLQKWFSFEEDYEWSVEANPAGLTREKIRILAEAGVNRISLGVQSFDDKILAFLERDHKLPEIEQAIHHSKERISNIAIDLIFAVPGQSVSLWEETLQKAISLNVQHVSTYGLTIEKGTGFWTRFHNQEFFCPEEELQSAMYELAMTRLPEAGFDQYELSNFAKPGYRCLHNQVYWQGDPFFGFGPGAASLIDGTRRTNHRSVTTWLKKVLAGESPVQDVDELTPEEKARERLIIGLRLCEGINEQEFLQKTGYEPDQLAGDVIRKYCDLELLKREEGMLRLTEKGRFLADSVIVDLL